MTARTLSALIFALLALFVVACSGHVDAELEPSPPDAAVELVNPDCHQIADKSACEDRVPGWVGPEPACGERAEFVWGCQHHYGECIRGPAAWVTRRCDGSSAHQPCESLTTREACEARGPGYAGEQPACGGSGVYYPPKPTCLESGADCGACTWWNGIACIDRGFYPDETYVCAGGVGDGMDR